MNTYFSTRKEARAHCKSLGIPFTRIFRDKSIALSWGVRTDEMSSFVVGKTYKIADEAGFIQLQHSRGINTSNKIQLEQIKKHLPDGFKIVKIDNFGVASFDAPVGVSFKTFRPEEIQFMTEVKEVEKPSVAVTSVGNSSAVSVNREEHPKSWVKGKQYIFAPNGAAGLANTQPKQSNKRIVDYINNVLGGVITIKSVDDDQAYFELKDDQKIHGDTLSILYVSDRKFFEEAVEVADLDAELNGGEPALPKELNPGKWIDGREYVLTDSTGFISAHAHNEGIVEKLNSSKYNGIVIPSNQKDNGSFYVDDMYFRKCERVFFTEKDSVSSETREVIHKNNIKNAHIALAAALETQKEATAALERANEAVYAAYDVLKGL